MSGDGNGVGSIRDPLADRFTLEALCESVGRPEDWPLLQAARAQAIADSVARANPADDFKSAAPTIYVEAKRLLGLSGLGNDQMAFARNVLAPLLKPGLAVHEELRSAVFD